MFDKSSRHPSHALSASGLNSTSEPLLELIPPTGLDVLSIANILSRGHASGQLLLLDDSYVAVTLRQLIYEISQETVLQLLRNKNLLDKYLFQEFLVLFFFQPF